MTSRDVWFARHSGPTHREWQQYSRDLELRIDAAFQRVRTSVATADATAETVTNIQLTTGGAFARYHDRTHDPVVLYQGNDAVGTDAIDASGNGYDAALFTGTADRTILLPGDGGPLRGYYFDGATYYQISGASSAGNNALRIAGDITIEWIGYWASPIGGGSRPVCGFGNTTGDLNTVNCLYRPSMGTDQIIFDFWEHDSGVNVTSNSLHTAQLWVPHHYAFVRTVSGSSATEVFYRDGQAYATATNTAPDGSADGIFRFGSGHRGVIFMLGAVASFKLIAGALSVADVKAEYNRTVGMFNGALA